MNNTSLAIIRPDELEVIQRAARMLAVSNYFDGKGDNPQAIAMIATKILAGREMGFGPFASANGIHIISGKPSVGANLMAAAVKSSGRYDYRVKEMTADKCIIEFFEREGDKKVSIGISEFTKEDAVKAGTQNRDKFPRNMYFARAMSNGVRWFCPDVFSGNAVYVPEELGADVDGDGNVVNATFTVTKPATEPLRVVDQDTGEIVSPEPATDSLGDVLFAKDESHESPPHRRMWGIGKGVFGNDWDMARPWIIRQWTHGHSRPKRSSAADLSDDEKTMLGDYLNENASKLQQLWPRQKAIMIQAVEAAQEQEPIATVA